MEIPDSALRRSSRSWTQEVIRSSPATPILRTPFQSLTRDAIPHSATSQWATPSISGGVTREPDLTASQRALVMSGSGRKYRMALNKRAKLISANGEVDDEGRPLPADPTKPKTSLTLPEIYAIAQEGDRSVMRECGELFITTGTYAFETKTEYAWIYLRRDEEGGLPVTEERLKALFPEWELVLNPTEESPLVSQSTQIMESPYKQEQSDSLEQRRDRGSPIGNGNYHYLAVSPYEIRDDPRSLELHRELMQLRYDNWHLQTEINWLRDEKRRSSSVFEQAEPRRYFSMGDLANPSDDFTELSGITPNKRSSEVAFGQGGDFMSSYVPGSRGVLNLNPELERLHLASHQSNAMADPYQGDWVYDEQLQTRQRKRSGNFGRLADEGNAHFDQVSRCIPEEARSQVLSSLSSEDDLTKIKLHSYGQFAPYVIPNAPPSVASSACRDNANIENPFTLTHAREPLHGHDMNRIAGLPEYPPLDDQFEVDTQLFRELRSSQSDENLALNASTSSLPKLPPWLRSAKPMDALVDPLFEPISSQSEPWQNSSSLANMQSSPTNSSLIQGATGGASAGEAESAPSGGSLKISRKCLAALNDPRLANDPIRKWHEEIDSMPVGIPKKYGQFKVQSELPDHLQCTKPNQVILNDKELYDMLDFGPSVRGLFGKYFRLRDGYLKPEFRYLLDEVDPATGNFRLPALQIYSLDPQMVPHYINRHYPGYKLRSTVRRQHPKRQHSTSGVKNEELEDVEELEGIEEGDEIEEGEEFEDGEEIEE
jgi:hypothetical protein